MGKHARYARLPKLVAVVQTLQQLARELPPHSLNTFLAVALSDGDVSIEELSLQLGIEQSTMSRNVKYLTEDRFGLLETGPHPTKWRYKTVRLSVRGRQLADKLDGLL